MTQRESVPIPLDRLRQGLPGLWLNLTMISGMWGSSFLFIKLMNDAVPPFSFAAARGFIATAALLAWLVARKVSLHARERPSHAMWSDFQHMVVLGTTNGWLANVMIVTALRYLDSAIVAIILATVPLLVIVLAHFAFAEEKFEVPQLLGVSIGFGGAFLVIGPLAVLGGRGSLIGTMAMLVIAVSYACGTLYGRRLETCDAVVIACGQQAIGAGIAGIICLFSETPNFVALPTRTWLLLITVGVLCSALPTALYLRLLPRTSSVAAASIAFLQPVWAMALGRTVLEEPIGAGALVGTALIVFGIFMISRPPR